ncbi:MAG TPA: response regulator transcription factor [Dehalococcoidia bacterium]|nr:response regulator transcription factor [Dehalococcoidia bacterium]
MNGPLVLIVDDEAEIRRALRLALEGRGYRVAAAASGEEAIAALEKARPEVVLLDLLMPGIGGLETCKRLRARWPVPIIVLSVMGQEHDKVAALDAGADDYLTKPFGFDELMARIRVAQRRAHALSGGDEPVYRSGELVLDLGRRSLSRGGSEIHLTPIEYEVLKYLAVHAGRVVTHHMLLHAVWGPEYNGDTQVLRYTITQLRKKLGDSAAQPRHLVTETGIGYRLLLDA